MNIAPTHIKILTTTAGSVEDANALMEASFQAWSKEHPEVQIVQVLHSVTIGDTQSWTNPSGCVCVEAVNVTVTLSVVHVLGNAAEGVRVLTHSMGVVINAWRNYLRSLQEGRADGPNTQLDMRIAMTAVLNELEVEYRRVREW